MKKNKSEKAVALLIILVFMVGAFSPVISSLPTRSVQDDTVLDQDWVNLLLNDELDLPVAEPPEEEKVLYLNDDIGGFAPLDRSPSFYDAVGRIYKRPANYAELVSWYLNLEQNYSDYITVFKANELYGTGTVPKTGGGGYDLYYVRVTNESQGLHKPEVFFCGGPHGGEKIGAIGLYWTLDWLMRHAFHPDYDCPERPYLRWLLDNREIYINVFHNPDGFDRGVRGDYLGRDLNREYDHASSWGPFLSVNGQTVMHFINDHLIRAAAFFHTGARKILYPWQIEHSSVTGVSPISGRSYARVPADFYFFDAAYLKMGDFIGNYGGNLGPNDIGSSYSMGFGGGGVATSWGYAGNNLRHPLENQYVQLGPHLGAGFLTTTLEMYGTGSPAESTYGNDTIDRFGAEVRRIVLYLTDLAQPSVHWTNGTTQDYMEINIGESVDFSWLARGCLTVDNTRIQYGTHPDPINNPEFFTANIDDHHGDYYGGSYWDNAESGSTVPTTYTEAITFTNPGDYFIVAKAMVDQKYAELLRSDYYGDESYLRLIQERTNASFYESLDGADGIEETAGQLWWYSPVIHVRVKDEAGMHWYNTSWAFRKEVIVNKTMVEENLGSFPLLIDLIDVDLVSKAQSTGHDIVFTDKDQNKLDHEIEFFDEGHLIAWVRVPVLLSTSDTVLYMYYGNSACDDQQNPSGVWDTNYMMVQHLSETSGTHYDSTERNNHGTPYGGVTQDAVGPIDGADYFDGIDDYVQIPHNSSISGFTQAMTVSAWMRLESNSSWVTLLCKYNTVGNQRGWQVYYDGGANPKTLRFVLASSGTAFTSYFIPFDAAADTWYHIAATWVSDQRPTIYVNGVAYTPTPTGTVTSIYDNPLEPLYIGRAYIGGTSDGRFLNGGIDEVRISNIARPEAWIKTSYNNQLSPADYISLGEEKGPMFVFNPSPGMNSQDVPRSTLTLSFNITHLQGKTMNYTVETVPDIGSDAAYGVLDGRYEVSVNGLDDCTVYRWYVNVTDGIDESSEMFIFITECQDPWWDADWLYRKKITIDSAMVPATLTDFPVLLSFNDADVANKAKASGDDIAFADQNGVQLDHEIELFQSNNLVAWVRIPTLLSNQNAIIYMYYGNADAENQQNPSGVWDENYMMVQHLSETSGTHYDSTSNMNDGAPMNGVIQQTIGKIDGANRFDGINDYVEVPHDDTLSGFSDAMTASAWVKLYDDSSRQTILNKYDTVDNQRSWALDYQQDAGTQFGFVASASPGSSFIAYLYDHTILPEVWYYVTVVWQANQVPRMYVNGVQLSTSTTTTLSNLHNNPGAPLFIGRSYASVSPQRYLNGFIDEVQVSNVARSAAWITASYLNQHNPVNFITVGSEESEHPLISDPLPINGAVGISIMSDQLSFRLSDRQGDSMDYTVETSPDVGSDSAYNVYNGRYFVNISGLDYDTTYFWFVNVTDGEHHSSQMFTFTTERAPIPWWNTDWSFRKEIILDHTKITDDLYDFPLLVSFDDPGIRIKARTDGLDIVFADDLGNKLDYEVEYYHKGKLDAWVRIPYLSKTTDTMIMVYYGNPDAEDQQNPSGVWDSNYMMVQHLSESPANGVAQGHVDSTSNNNHGTAYNFDGTSTSTTNAIGKINGANWFDGTNDYIQVPHDDTLAGFTDGMTASAWVKFDTTNERRSIVGKYAIATPQRSWNVEYIVSPSRALQFTASSDGAEPYSYWFANVGTLSTDVWYHVAVGWQSGEEPTFYLNGNKIPVSRTDINLTQLFNNVNTPLYIGRTYRPTDRYWDGLIDEVRVSNINRSAAWIKTSYNNQLNPSSFYLLGSEEMGIAPDEPFLYDEDPQDESIIVPVNPTLSISVIDYQDDIIDVYFRTNASGGEWVTIGSHLSGYSGTFTQETTTMNEYSTTYYWSVNCTDSENYWSNNTYSFTTKDSNYPPTLSNPSPSNGATGVAPIPTLSITVHDVDEDLLTVLIKSNCTGPWEIQGEFHDVPSGTYSLLPQGINERGKRYYWSVHCFDGVVWVNQTYSFTMSTTVLTLKWTQTTASTPYGAVVAADINGDGADELFQAGGGMAHCLDGKTGNIIWQRSVSGGSGQPQMADCNGDGILDLIVTIASSGIEVLHGANGTTYWRTTGLGGSSMNSPVAFDIDGDGRAEVFYSSQDITNGWNGTGRVTSLTHDGRIVNQLFAYRPCAGGLSLADTNFDGQFELYMGDRHQSYSGDGGVPRGLRAFLIDEDGTIHCNWNRSDILMSSHCPMIADINGDGKLDIVACHQVGGIWVIDSTSGATIRGAYTVRCSDNERFPGHYQPSICDINGDGNIEVLAADGDHPEPYTTDKVAIWDLVAWTEKALLPHICKMGPTTGDVIGNGQLDVLVSSFSGIHVYTWNHTTNSLQFVEQRTGLSGTAGPALVTDIDGDGYNELVVATSTGRFYVYDTYAPTPDPKPLAGIQHYSTYRNGQAIYTEPPGIKRPLVKDVHPANNSQNIDLSPMLSFRVIDYQHDPISITISSNASGQWKELASYTDMKTGNSYYVPCPAMNIPGTTYYWRVTATDGTHTTTETYRLTTYPPSPFKPGWLYRIKIMLNQSLIPSDLVDFPVLIDLIDEDLGLKAKPNGDDLLFTGIDGATVLDYEIEYYNSTTGHLVAWVKTNVSAVNGTFIYLYYGNEGAVSHENPQAVWDPHYMMVQHLSETSGTHYDSTIYGNHGTPLNGVMQDIMGKIDGADEFDGVNDYISVPHNDTLAGFTEGLTASTWFKLDTVARRQTLLCKYQTTGNQRGYYLDFVNSPAAFHLYASEDGVNYVYWTAAFTPVVGEWYHVAFTWAPNTIPKMYVNGQKIAVARTQLISAIYNNAAEPLRIASSYATGRQLDGCLDEVRISDIARSEAWIKTSYNNQVNPSAFYTVSPGYSNFTLTTTTSGNGSGTVEFFPLGPYYPDQVVTLWANASAGSVFTTWGGDLTGYASPIVLVMNSDKVVDAEFLYGMHTLRVSTTPTWIGSVEKDPDQLAYSLGSQVQLTAIPNPSWAFWYWTGDLAGTNNPSTLTITGNMTVTAVFRPLYDDIVFDSNFESGNLINVQYQSGDAAGNRFYTASVNYSTVTFTDKHWWFYFSMQNTQGKTITVQLKDLAAADFGSGDTSRWGNIEPVYSYDNSLWERLPLAKVQVNPTARTFTMTITPLQDTVWLAPIPPYTPTLRDALFDEFTDSPYMVVSTLGITPGGLPMKAVTITDPAYQNDNKYRVYITANQHANEVPTSWLADGMIRFLLNETNLTAAALRQQYIFKIIPIVNVDGVTQGISRYTPVRDGVQYDLNRQWNLATGSMQPEVLWIYLDLQSWRPHAYIDVHSTVNAEGAGSSRDCMYLAPALTNVKQKGFMDNISLFWPESCPRSTTSYGCAYVRSRLGIEPSISMELPHDELRTMVPLRKLLTSDWQTWGGQVAQGIFSYFGTTSPLLVDSEFSDSVDSDDLRANSQGQDWYESRGAFSGGDSTLLTLNTTEVGGNSGKKAALKNFGIASNAFLTQEFRETLYNPFTVSFDIYIDRIQDNANYDRAGHIYIGNDATTSNAPTGQASERFVCLAFYDPTPGDTGDDIQLRARTSSGQAWATTSQWLQVATGLSYKTWYTLTIVVRPNADSANYDVYINDTLIMANIPRYNQYSPATSITFISFASDGDARGDFLVDNVFCPATDRHFLMVDVIGEGTIQITPQESTYAHGSLIELSAQPAEDWKFSGWSGDVTSMDNPLSIIMEADTNIIATFQDAIPPQISNVEANPQSASQGDYVNISCEVTDNIMVDTVKVDIQGPAGFTPVNATMAGSYYYNSTYTVVGTYDYFIWANDTSGNTQVSTVYQFTITAATTPVIVDNSPDVTYTGDTFIVNATVTDDDGIAGVWLEYWFEGGTKHMVSLQNTGSDYYEYDGIIIPLDSLDDLYYNISAQDTTGSWGYLLQQHVAVLDNLPPQIDEVMATPSSTPQGGSVNITCEVTDNIMVDTVKVDIQGPAGFTPANVTMAGGYYYNSTYTVVGTYDYFIWANDTSGNTVMSTVYQFTINVGLFDDVVFDSDFEMGNLKNVQYQQGDALGNRYYTAELNYSTDTFTEMLWWFHFSMQDAQGKTITVELQDLPPEDFGIGGGKPRWQTMWPVYSYDYTHWSRVPLENISWDSTALNFSMRITSTEEMMWVAASPPYTLSMRDEFLASYAESMYLETYSLGTTPLGFPLIALNITDPTVPDEGKHKVYIISSQHSGETVPTFVAEGMLSLLLNETNPIANTLRQHCIFKVIPIVNVEGTFLGVGRYTPFRSGVQYDLNRQWNLAVASMQPEIQWIFTEIQTWSPDVFIDLHDDSVSEDCFFYRGGSHATTYQLMDAIATYWPETDTSRLLTSQSAGQVYNRLGIYASVLMEHPHDNRTSTLKHPTDHNPQTIADWKQWGSGIAYGLYDFFDLQQFTVLLLDSEFSDSVDSDDLRANSEGQDWYESRGQVPLQLTLNTDDIGGNQGKKAALHYYDATGNYFTYLTQEFMMPQSGVFTVSMDMYIDRIADDADIDRTGFIYLGDDSDGNNGPCSTGVDRFMQLVFYDPTPGEPGDDLQIRAREYNNPTTLPPPAVNQPWTTTSTWTLVKDGLSYDTWYTIELLIDVPNNTYDVYVDGVLARADLQKYEQFNSTHALTHISFSSGYQARGDFFVDNVFSPAVKRHRLMVDVIGEGLVSVDPGESTYANGSLVQLSAEPQPGWAFAGFSGDVTSMDNPLSILMEADTSVIATFRDALPPQISDVSATPPSTLPGEQVNISCAVTDNVEVDVVKVSIVGPAGFTPANVTMQGSYYYTASYTIVGTYEYFIWANDTSGNVATSAVYQFVITSSVLLTDSEFSDSVDSDDLRANSEGQDWYESRNDNPLLLTLDTEDIGGNSGKKAAIKNYGVSNNVYLTQEFSSPQSGTFDVSFDIYIDRIEDNGNYDRTGHIYIGNNQNGNAYPLDTARERYVLLAFYDPTAGSTEDDLQLRVRTLSTTAQSWTNTGLWPVVATGLSYDTWYTVKIAVDYQAGTYDVTINGVTSTWPKMDIYNTATDPPITYISFSADSNARGDFYVDNVFSPATTRYTLTTSVVGQGVLSVDPGESTYANGALVQLSAEPQPGWAFAGFSGDVTSMDNPLSILMEADTSVIATFRDALPPQISDVSATPPSTLPGEQVNISCAVTDNVEVDVVKVSIVGPAGFTPANVTMQGSYYYTASYTIVGTYEYFIWANDTSGNSNRSATYTFEITGVLDNEPPVVHTLSATPELQQSGQMLNISASITDNIAVTQVWLNIQSPDASLQNISIVGNLIDDVYFYNNSYSLGGVYDYWVWAADAAGNSVLSSVQQFTIVRWHVPLGVLALSGEYDTVLFGEVDDASDGQDAYDVPKPGVPPYPFVSAWFVTTAPEPYNMLWSDYRQYPDSQKKWDLSILWVREGTGPVTVSWEPLLPGHTEYEYMSLYDTELSVWTDMYATTSYTYTATSGVLRQFEISCSVSSPVYHHEILVKEQWNMISAPVNMTFAKASITVEYQGMNYSWAEAFGAGLFIDCFYGIDASGTYEASAVLEPGKGYWFYSYEDISLWVTGELNTDSYIRVLTPTWNFVSVPAHLPVATQDLVVYANGESYPWNDAVSAGIVMGTLFLWDATLQTYDAPNVLHPGKAYWMYAFEECTLHRGGM